MGKSDVKVSEPILSNISSILSEWGCTPEQASVFFGSEIRSLNEIVQLNFKEEVGDMCIAIACVQQKLYRKYPKKDERNGWIHTPRESGQTFLEAVIESETPRETMLKISEEL